MEEIRQEQLRNMQLKERRPQRLAPIHPRDNGEEIGEGLNEIERPTYDNNQVEDDNNEIGDKQMSGAEEEPREATQMAEAQDEAQPSAVEE
jgi:hypothetical protein